VSEQASAEPSPDITCSFCDKRADEVKMLISRTASTGPRICNECVALCCEIIRLAEEPDEDDEIDEDEWNIWYGTRKET
jgi:ATP-dependent protease Clp ATPase subunit